MSDKPKSDANFRRKVREELIRIEKKVDDLAGHPALKGVKRRKPEPPPVEPEEEEEDEEEEDEEDADWWK